MTRAENLLRNHLDLYYIVSKISKISFAIYAMHIFIGGAFYKWWESYNLTIPMGDAFPPPIAIIFYAVFILAVAVCAYLIAQIFQKSSFIKRYVLLMK